MRTIVIAALLIAVACGAQAQVKKCIGPDGKVTYSDFICGKETAKQGGVATGANTIDTSGYRQEAAKQKAEQRAAEVAATKKAKNVDPCPTGDPKARIACVRSLNK